MSKFRFWTNYRKRKRPKPPFTQGSLEHSRSGATTKFAQFSNLLIYLRVCAYRLCSAKLSFSEAMPSPGGKVPPKGADEERRQLTTRSAVKLRAYSLQNSTFFTNCVYSRYISPLLISLASLDSFPPGEAMGAPAPVQLCSPFQSIPNVFQSVKPPA